MYGSIRGSGRLMIVLLAAALLPLAGATQPPQQPQPARYIVQSASAGAAAAAVQSAGGAVVRQLDIINGVSADLTPAALARLEADPRVTLHLSRVVRAAELEVRSPGSGSENDTGEYLLYPATATGAALLHSTAVSTTAGSCTNWQVTSGGTAESLPLMGWGVTVAVIDSGFMRFQNRQGSQSGWNDHDPATGALFVEGDARPGGGKRCILYRDFLERSPANENVGQQGQFNSTDQNGHGTHVISTIADNRRAWLGPNLSGPVGVAPKVNLVIARALNSQGAGRYDDVIAAIQWVLDNQARYNIRVLNLSIYAPVTGPYWSDPLNQAVMEAWRRGLVVVVAAGNDGPDAGTITAPGNVPYVITVGAMRSGRYNASGEDELADYSSRGPTESAFVKPDVLVPSTRTIAPVPDSSIVAMEIPQARIHERADVDFALGRPDRRHTYYQLSGTSMGAAQVSGIVALMLQANPGLTNEQVKYRLMATARPAVDEATGKPAYSIWEQGAGLVDARQAVLCDSAPAEACALGIANEGMDITRDLATNEHYWGFTGWVEPPGEFRLVDENGEALVDENGQPLSVWSGGKRVWSGGRRVWSGGRRVWSGGKRVWSGGKRVWSGSTWAEDWTSEISLWAGGKRVWSGSVPVTNIEAATSGVDLVISDERDPPLYEVALSMVLR